MIVLELVSVYRERKLDVINANGYTAIAKQPRKLDATITSCNAQYVVVKRHKLVRCVMLLRTSRGTGHHQVRNLPSDCLQAWSHKSNFSLLESTLIFNIMNDTYYDMVFLILNSMLSLNRTQKLLVSCQPVETLAHLSQLEQLSKTEVFKCEKGNPFFCN